jgi:Uma2 family endonuclease
MVTSSTRPLTLIEFLALPAGETSYELIHGEAIAKVSPKWLHAKSAGSLYLLLSSWGQSRGKIGIEWAVTLQRQGVDWVPVPDLLYVSSQRLDLAWQEDAPCPVPPDLAIEIISPDQTFGTMVAKASDYLAAGVLRVWIVDPRAESITVFYPDAPPRTYTGETLLVDVALPELQLTAQQVFQSR